jgi:hypothetical protein
MITYAKSHKIPHIMCRNCATLFDIKQKKPLTRAFYFSGAGDVI